MVADHPIYNFMHTYYRFSISDISVYSPGIHIVLDDAHPSTLTLLHPRHQVVTSNNGCYYDPCGMPSTGIHGWPTFLRSLDILESTSKQKPIFYCFGLHEWAMLYSGKTPSKSESASASASQPDTAKRRHQPQLQLRVTQSTINDIVESQMLHCTHYDAWRFFHEDAQVLNPINPLFRSTQAHYEQPACIHANMDLFKYAYQAYPLISSELLVKSLELAIDARKIDMRASPYDVSAIEGCEVAITVETEEGRRLYVREQEQLTKRGVPIRQELLEEYLRIFSIIKKS